MSQAVFLDTQIYLHYQPFNQINWLELLGTTEATLIIPPITIRELNKHKELHPRPRVKKRAGLILNRLFSLFDSTSQANLRDNVKMRLEDRDPIIDFAAFDLSRDIQDDHLIACIIMFRNENPETDLVLVTSDAGLALVAKANRLGIPTIRLPDNFKLPEETDPERTRIRELEKELRELKLKVPRPSLVFEGGTQHAAFTLPRPIQLSQEDLENEVLSIQQRYPKMEHKPQYKHELPEHLAATAKTLASLEASIGNTISPEDIDNYNTQVDNFYQEYSDHQRKNIHHQNLKCRAIKLKIFVANDGGAPAEDLDVFLHFPDGINLTDEEGFPQYPTPPKPPTKPRTQMQKMYQSLTGSLVAMPPLASYIPATIGPAPNVSTHNIKRTGSFDVNFNVQRVKHNLQEPADPLYVIFESFESAHSFHIDYQILAANVVNEVTGHLHVVIDKD